MRCGERIFLSKRQISKLNRSFGESLNLRFLTVTAVTLKGKRRLNQHSKNSLQTSFLRPTQTQLDLRLVRCCHAQTRGQSQQLAQAVLVQAT
jgi:hypothetical protein